MNQFQENLLALRKSHPVLAQQVSKIQGGVLVIQEAKSGLPTATAHGRLLHSAYDPKREAECWAEQHVKECGNGERVVVLGVGLLYHLEALCQELASDIAICVPIPSLSEFADCLRVRPLAGWSDRVQWVWGNTSEMVEKMDAQGTPIRILNYQPAVLLHESEYERFHSVLRDYLSRNLSGSLHIMVVGPIYGGSLPIAGYVVRALEDLGHRVSWVDHSMHYPGYDHLNTIRDDRLRLTVQQRFSETLGVISLAHVAEDPPDLILALSQAPLSMPVLEQFRRKKVLTAMWFVENFRHLTYWQQMIAGYDYWFVMQQDPCLQAFRNAGASHVSYLPLAADPSIHRPLTLSREEHKEFGADVSFLGAGYWNRRNLLPELLGHPWSFKLWGNEWGNSGPLEGVLQRGGARIDTETSVKIFNASSINMNLHSYTKEGFDPEGDGVNPRTFELAASEAFQITDRRTLLPELFDESMMAIIRKPEDMVPVVKQYLHDPEKRKAMAALSRQQVLSYHTYQHRMETFLSEVGLANPDRLGAVLRGNRQAQALQTRTQSSPELQAILQTFPPTQRVEVEHVASCIREKGPEAVLGRDELLLLMMDEYRQEKRDFL